MRMRMRMQKMCQKEHVKHEKNSCTDATRFGTETSARLSVTLTKKWSGEYKNWL
jgi:hypothetical protein